MKSQPVKKSQEVLGENSIILLTQSYHEKPPQSSDFWDYCAGPLVWWTHKNSKPPVSKEKNRFVWLPPPKLFS